MFMHDLAGAGFLRHWVLGDRLCVRQNCSAGINRQSAEAWRDTDAFVDAKIAVQMDEHPQMNILSRGALFRRNVKVQERANVAVNLN